MTVFENLGEEKAKKMVDELIAKGYSKDDAFGEVYSIECNMDTEENILEKKIEDYIKNNIRLDDYDLGGVEITEDDYSTIAERFKKSSDTLETVIQNYLYEIREILDEGLDDLEEDDDLSL